MDDLKLFAKGKPETEKLVEPLYLFSRDIGMEFGILKFTMLTLKQVGNCCRGIELPNGVKMEEPDDNEYKPLGVLRLENILHRAEKRKTGSSPRTSLKIKTELKEHCDSHQQMGYSSWGGYNGRLSNSIVLPKRELQ